jgi:hypothetical protein
MAFPLSISCEIKDGSGRGRVTQKYAKIANFLTE